ncbi:MAG: hypothetical protein PHT40_03960 [Patescibacteria group bacterium]|nr:hypothetical protein [Patescibacteria group bacterium]
MKWTRKETASIFLCTFTFLAIWLPIEFYKHNHVEKSKVIPVTNEIKRAIHVKAASPDNKIIIDRRIGIFVIGNTVVDMNSAPVTAWSAAQFESMVSPNEPVYSSLSPGNEEGFSSNYSYTMVTKYYMSFLKNKSVPVVYSRKFSYKEGNYQFEVKTFSNQEILFYYNDRDITILTSLFLGAFTFIVGCIICYKVGKTRSSN